VQKERAIISTERAGWNERDGMNRDKKERRKFTQLAIYLLALYWLLGSGKTIE
jgi:hypothetical protein